MWTNFGVLGALLLLLPILLANPLVDQSDETEMWSVKLSNFSSIIEVGASSLPKIQDLPSDETGNVSQVRQNYHRESEDGINHQIHLELYASYVYMSMAAYFDRDDVALNGFVKFFKRQSDEEREHAEKLIHYQNKRGGRVVLAEIQKPEKDNWGTGLDAMQTSLEFEKKVNGALLELRSIAAKHNDSQMANFIESEFLSEQVESIKKFAGYISNLKRAGSGLGEFLFNQDS